MTQEQVLKLFDYKDGRLFFKAPTTNSHTIPGTIVGHLDPTRGKGYYITSVNGKRTSIHRIIYLMFHGWLPDFIDHIDCNPQNNKIENLRAATRIQNSCNRGKQSDNKSGYKGVSWSRDNKKWKAQITVNKKKIYIGLFENPLEASYAYRYAALYHFKEFAHV